MAQQRAWFDARPALRIDVGMIDEVARHQIDRAFDPFEFAAYRARERAQQGRLADADVAFEQHVPAREDRDREETNGARKAEHALVQRALETERAVAPFAQFS
ncbi:MAG TPA: hypothetical protein VJ862_09215, partial [Rhodanobacteraceae bacterium]|nr:hypothetical protein [Rhodanobacteraceae bacterium]